MTLEFSGTPSDQVPDILATGKTAVRHIFISFSARDPDGRDADYIEWHSMDHRPEQYRLPHLRGSLRLVSTPECRTARAANSEPYSTTDHVMTYFFTGPEGLPGFFELGDRLDKAGRMEHRLPSVTYMVGDLAGKVAANRAVVGSDVLPWRPMTGVFLILERGHATPEPLAEVPGVAGVWWFDGAVMSGGFGTDSTGLRATYCFIDGDPVDAASTLDPALKQRWASGEIEGLFAAPFYNIVPFDWSRYLP